MKKYSIDPLCNYGGKLIDNDIVLFRFADVLLMRAEAKVRLGQDGYEDMNRVRRRAEMQERPCTLETLLDERLLELCWEGWRRQDLIRFGCYRSLYDGPDAVDESDGHTAVYPIPGNVKTLNLMPAVKYSQEARYAGVDEAVLHRNGVVTECAHSNVHILKDGILYTHPNDEYILRGIAKTRLIQICYHENVPVIERAFTVDELMAADEVIVTSSGDLLVFADEVDGVPVGGKDPDTLGRLRRAVYRDFIDYTGATQLF